MKIRSAFVLSLFVTSLSFAHDEGHGPKITESPKQGGTLAAVVNLKDANKGSSAALQFKSEFVRSDDGSLKLYLYDESLNPVDLKSFDSNAKGVVEVMKKKKVAKKLPFTLKLEGDAYVGKAPKSPSKPYNIYVVLKRGGKEYLSELSNLD